MYLCANIHNRVINYNNLMLSEAHERLCDGGVRKDERRLQTSCLRDMKVYESMSRGVYISGVVVDIVKSC